MKYHRLYIIVRKDLPPGYQIAQSIHSKDKFTHDHPEIEQHWYEKSNTIVVLHIKSEQELLKLTNSIMKSNLKYSLFFEVDIDQYTSLAVEPGVETTRMFKSFKLAGGNHY